MFMPASALLSHWQGHRRLTRKVIEAFPEEQFSRFSIGSMRPFGAMVMEMLGIGEPMLRGILSGEWDAFQEKEPLSKEEILREWDKSTTALDELWPQIPPERFLETITTFGQFTGVVYDQFLYAIDNEIHHRAQGYVYLRALGIEPPAFYDRD
jgi:uncharacterized damage-inducible protein DinB